MGTPTRRAVFRGTAVFAGPAAVQTSGLATAAEADQLVPAAGTQDQRAAGARGMVDGSNWNRVMSIPQQHGHTVLAGHSYGAR